MDFLVTSSLRLTVYGFLAEIKFIIIIIIIIIITVLLMYSKAMQTYLTLYLRLRVSPEE